MHSRCAPCLCNYLVDCNHLIGVAGERAHTTVMADDFAALGQQAQNLIADVLNKVRRKELCETQVGVALCGAEPCEAPNAMHQPSAVQLRDCGTVLTGWPSEWVALHPGT